MAPKAKTVVGCLIRIAAKTTAASFPESEVLVNVVGAATEAAEEALSALAPAQKAQA